MDIFVCGHNSFDQLNFNLKSLSAEDQYIQTQQQSVLEPCCQVSLPEDADKADITIRFTWSRSFFSIKRRDIDKFMTFVVGSHTNKIAPNFFLENTCCACGVDGNGAVLLRDTINPDKLSILCCGGTQPLPLNVKRDEKQESVLNLQCVAGGHNEIYAVYDGVSFGKFQLPNNLGSSYPDSDKEVSPDVNEKEVTLSIEHIDFVTPIKEISCGKEHVLLLSCSGSVYSYGLSSRGQLGHGEIENETSPRLLDALDGLMMKTVVAGGWHSVAVSEIGDLYVWGWNESGQLGLKSAKEGESKGKGLDFDENAGIVSIPICIDTPYGKNVKSAACGSRHTVVLTEACEIFTCGWNGYGQLGLGDTANRDGLTRVDGLVGYKVFAGHWNSAFVCSKGQT